MIIIRKAAPGMSEHALARFAQRARKAAGLRGQVNVVLTSSRDIRALNRRFRGKDKPTDVLSFPALQAVWPGSKTRATRASNEFSGDIVISTDIARRNARLYQHAPAQELKILMLHGMLHLAGFDHETDRGEMARQEERLRRELGLSNGLIGRTGKGCGAALRPEHAGPRPAPHKQSRRRAR
jgi:probable rRNA maturation factor